MHGTFTQKQLVQARKLFNASPQNLHRKTRLLFILQVAFDNEGASHLCCGSTSSEWWQLKLYFEKGK